MPLRCRKIHLRGICFAFYDYLDSDTIISVIIGTIGAFGLVRFEFRLKKLVNGTLYIPVVIPEVVLGI